MSTTIEPPDAVSNPSEAEDPNRPSSGLRSLAEDAYERILAEILGGVLSPTEDNPSSEIALQKQYDFGSRMPIRMALAVLASEGLIAQRARHGFWIVDYSDHDLKQIGGMRADADAMVASSLGASIANGTIATDSEAFQLIRESLHEMRVLAQNAPQGTVDRGVEMEFANHDTRFHTFIAAATDYTLAARHIRQWRNLVRLYRVRHDVHYTGQDLEAICGEHAWLIGLIDRPRDQSIEGIDAMIQVAATSHVANSLVRCDVTRSEVPVLMEPVHASAGMMPAWVPLFSTPGFGVHKM